ncbi:MAG: T9SS type A sorting domain-containing protein [Reichenbachiella sp.]|uniref:T9SS type A sorting domain-containing protein n=1 Tax=Reichenbachiella sp. TaxID=2184521 RepID=UPI002966D26B|nr:T9SS type A sorting domain-containing protein [Reichenbachiella sp.]MDW3209353.1 T9SS type A sorting domain-containing protein [Reichenbachiella sp.]
MMKRIFAVLIFGLITWSDDLLGQNQWLVSEDRNERISEITPIEVFPNPVVEYLNIRPTQFNGETTRLEIMDLSGHVVYQVNETFTELSIFVGDWRKGVYMIRFIQGKVESTHKVIVQ